MPKSKASAEHSPSVGEASKEKKPSGKGVSFEIHPHAPWQEILTDRESESKRKSIIKKTPSTIPLYTIEQTDETRKETKIPCTLIKPRTVLAIMGFFSFFVFATLRINISMAIVAMVNWQAINVKKKLKGMCEYGGKSNRVQAGGKFAWDPEMQGYILSSYYIGLAATQLLGGRLAEKFSAKQVLFYGTLLATITTLLSPEAAKFNEYCLIALQILKGAGQGILVPAYSTMIGNWVPVAERTTFLALTTSGLPLGSFVSTLVSGYLCRATFMGGWPSVFYVSGFVGVVWCVLWLILIYDSPTEHPWIPRSELVRFMSIRTQQAVQLKPPIPLKAMATSLPAWAYIFVGFASFWTISLYSLVLPTFMGTILRFPIEINGILSSLPNLVQAIFMLCSSVFCDFLVGNRYAAIPTIRKTTLTLGFIGFTACMIGITFVGCSRVLNVVLLTLALGLTGINLPTIMVLAVDLTPKFAGTLSGFQSTFGSLSGLLIPLIIGFLTEGEQSLREWNIMFYISGGICLFSVIFFLIFGQSEVQPWNYQLTYLGSRPNSVALN